MTIGNMRGPVVLELPPPGDRERGPVARSRTRADLRPAHGVHPMRLHWRGRAAERQFAEMAPREAKFPFELDYLPRKGGLGNAQAQRGV